MSCRSSLTFPRNIMPPIFSVEEFAENMASKKKAANNSVR
jgi:hypothetical protein